MNPWLQFAVVIFAQLVVFLIFVYIKKVTWKQTLKVLGCSLLIGIPFGIAFDLWAGWWLGGFSYELGFMPLFLLVNGAFSYGLMMASVTVLDLHPFSHFYGFVLLKGVVYEVVNFLSPVWHWQFVESFWLQEAVIVFVGYAVLAVLMRSVYTALVSDSV